MAYYFALNPATGKWEKRQLVPSPRTMPSPTSETATQELKPVTVSTRSAQPALLATTPLSDLSRKIEPTESQKILENTRTPITERINQAVVRPAMNTTSSVWNQRNQDIRDWIGSTRMPSPALPGPVMRGAGSGGGWNTERSISPGAYVGRAAAATTKAIGGIPASGEPTPEPGMIMAPIRKVGRDIQSEYRRSMGLPPVTEPSPVIPTRTIPAPRKEIPTTGVAIPVLEAMAPQTGPIRTASTNQPAIRKEAAITQENVLPANRVNRATGRTAVESPAPSGNAEPIHLIRGTQESWWSPKTSEEYATKGEAISGVHKAESLADRRLAQAYAQQLALQKLKNEGEVEARRVGEKGPWIVKNVTIPSKDGTSFVETSIPFNTKTREWGTPPTFGGGVGVDPFDGKSDQETADSIVKDYREGERAAALASIADQDRRKRVLAILNNS